MSLVNAEATFDPSRPRRCGRDLRPSQSRQCRFDDLPRSRRHGERPPSSHISRGMCRE